MLILESHIPESAKSSHFGSRRRKGREILVAQRWKWLWQASTQRKLLQTSLHGAPEEITLPESRTVVSEMHTFMGYASTDSEV